MKFKSKYAFGELAIDETITVFGKPSNIRSAASNWGRRYGIWLRVETLTAKSCQVTRTATPVSKARTRTEEPNLRLQRLEDGMRFISVLLIRMDKNIQTLLHQ